MIDVVLWNTLGPPFTYETAMNEPLGGSEYEMVQVAHALARRGHRVVVANGVRSPVDQAGVWYIPNRFDAVPAELRAGVRALWIERCSLPPEVKATTTVVRATDCPVPEYDRVLPLTVSGQATLVCNTQWHAKLFPFAKRKAIIPPMIGPIPQKPVERGRFVYTCAPSKGLAQTLALWTGLKSNWPSELRGARLEVAIPGHSCTPDELEVLERAKEFDVSFHGALTCQGLRDFAAGAEGLFLVSAFSETFCCAAVIAELAGARTHILAMAGKAGIEEALSDSRRLTRDPAGFVAQFMDDWTNGPSFPPRPPTKDYSEDAIAKRWETLLGLEERT